MTATGWPPTLPELQAAVRALRAGQFRPPSPADTDAWRARVGPRVVPVLGADGHCGATTVALALATVLAPARLVDCAPLARSGLVAAAYRELGETDQGWLRGQRDQVQLERRSGSGGSPDTVPAPLPATGDTLTVLDVAWPPAGLPAGGWLAQLVHTVPAVIVGHATIPGLRHLEVLLDVLPPSPWAVVLAGPARRRWPKGLTACLGPHSRTLDDDGRLLTLPPDPNLAVSGLDASPLPAPLITLAATVAALLPPTHHHPEGNPS